MTRTERRSPRMARLLPVALLVLSLADAIILPYTSQETGRTLTLCACAKCGSTSVANSVNINRR